MYKNFIAGILSCVSLTTMAQAGRLVLEVDLSEEQKTAIYQKFVEPYNQTKEMKSISQIRLEKNDPNDLFVYEDACLGERYFGLGQKPETPEISLDPLNDVSTYQRFYVAQNRAHWISSYLPYPELKFLQTAKIEHELMYDLTEDEAWNVAKDLRKTAGNVFNSSEEAGLTYTLEKQERIGDLPYDPPYRYLHTNASIKDSDALEVWMAPWNELEKISQFKRNPFCDFGTIFTYAQFSTNIGLPIPTNLLDKAVMDEIKNVEGGKEPLTLSFKKLKLTYVPTNDDGGEGFTLPVTLDTKKL